MTKAAYFISKMEGFGIPGAVPTTHHNPGDLRHSPHSSHLIGEPDGIGMIPTDELGWADLERQLLLYASRGMTLQQAIYEFAPPSENNSERYLTFVAEGLGVPITTPMKDVLDIMVIGDLS